VCEADCAAATDIRENDDSFVKNLTSTLGTTIKKIKSHFRLGAVRNKTGHKKTLKIVFETQVDRNDFLHATMNLRRLDVNRNFHGIFV